MHCAACEILLEKKIQNLKGVHHVHASLIDKKIEMMIDSSGPRTEDLNKQFADLGYSFSVQPVGQATFSLQSVVSVLFISIAFAVVFFILNDSGILANAAVSTESSYLAFFVLGVIASLSTCAALVGGLILSLSKQWNTLYGGVDANERAKPFFMFNIGRLISYGVLGAVIGYIGSFFTISLQFTATLIIMVSVIMIWLGLQMLGVRFAKKVTFALPGFISSYISDEKHFQGRYMPFLMGALTFFIPCGFTLMAQTVALTTGNPVQSMLMMVSFALGTLPVLAVISFSSMKLQKSAQYAGTFNLLVGLFIIGFGFYNINSQLNVLGMKNATDFVPKKMVEYVPLPQEERLGVIMKTENGTSYQQLTLKAEGFGYLPREVTLKVGIPVRLKVLNTNVVGCAQAMYLPGLYDKVLYLTGTETEAEFTPQQTGTFKISCTMGMVPPIVVTVES